MNSEALAGVGRHRQHLVGYALGLQQGMHSLAGAATCSVQGQHIGAQPVQHPRHIDAAAAWVYLGHVAAQLVGIHQPIHRGGNVERRVGREGDEAGHGRSRRKKRMHQIMAAPLCRR